MGQLRIQMLGLRGVTGQFLGADEKYLAEVEKQIGFKLPDAFTDFMRRFGASLFTEDIGFKSIKPSPWAVDGIEAFDVFYGPSEKAALDLAGVNVRLRSIRPSRTVAIGHDSGSNLLLLAADGQVYFFDRETGKKYLAAETFAQLLDAFVARQP